MPFTLAHPAAILPFLRQPFVPIALLAGALAPDLPYFLKLPVNGGQWYEAMFMRNNTHDMAQILTMGLPLAILLALFLWLVADPLRWATPDTWLPNHQKLGRDPSAARVALWIFYSLMVGLFTHIAWDSFTHATGWVVQQLPFLGTQIIAGIPLFNILQHASTAAGALILVLWYLKRLKVNPAKNPRTQGNGPRLALLAAVLIIPAVITAIIGYATDSAAGAIDGAASFLWTTITYGGMGLLISLTVYGAIWQVIALSKRMVAAR